MCACFAWCVACVLFLFSCFKGRPGRYKSWEVARSMLSGVVTSCILLIFQSILIHAIFSYTVPVYPWLSCYLINLILMDDQHMKDLSLAASFRESVAFNDIVRWNKIFVKWGSICYQQQQVLNISSDEAWGGTKNSRSNLIFLVIFWLSSIHVLYLINTKQRSMKTWRLVLSISLVSLNLVSTLSCFFIAVCLP
jgi:hypothetical protein